MKLDESKFYVKIGKLGAVINIVADNFFWDILDAQIFFKLSSFEIQILEFSNDLTCWRALY